MGKKKSYDKKTIGLEKGTFKRNVQWAIDQDYVDTLKEQAKSSDPQKAKEAQATLEFVSKFNNEYYGGSVKKGDEEALHNTDELRKDCYDRNNRSNRDIYSIYDAGGAIIKGDDADLLIEEAALNNGLTPVNTKAKPQSKKPTK